jgi:hypothetical protein
VQLHSAAHLTSSASGLVRKNKNKLDCRDHVIFSCTEKHKLFENIHNISRLDSFHGSNSNDISRLHVKKGSNSNSDMYNLDYFHIPDNTIACVGDDLYRGGDLHDTNYDIKKHRPVYLDIYLDAALAFGYRHGTLNCTRVTDAIRYICAKNVIILVNYIDDLILIARDSEIQEQFQFVIQLLKSLNLEISEDKTVVPTKKAVCLGIEFDTYRGNISIPKSKLKEIINQCKRFLYKSKITKNQIQSLLGSLLFLHKAIKPARAFVNIELLPY